jgi:hypothetical protein
MWIALIAGLICGAIAAWITRTIKPTPAGIQPSTATILRLVRMALALGVYASLAATFVAIIGRWRSRD